MERGRAGERGWRRYEKRPIPGHGSGFRDGISRLGKKISWKEFCNGPDDKDY